MDNFIEFNSIEFRSRQCAKACSLRKKKVGEFSRIIHVQPPVIRTQFLPNNLVVVVNNDTFKLHGFPQQNSSREMIFLYCLQ